jgi:AcrR family transcriptional regulator
MLKASVSLLAEGDLGEVTLAEIGVRAGYSRGLASHYFGTKSRLMAAVVDHLVQSVLAVHPRASPDGMTGADVLRHWLSVSIDDIKRRAPNLRAYFNIVAAYSSAKEVREAFHRENEAILGYLADTVDAGRHDGSVQSNMNRLELATAIAAMARGITWEAHIDPEVDMRVRKKALMQALEAMLAPRSPAHQANATPASRLPRGLVRSSKSTRKR